MSPNCASPIHVVNLQVLHKDLIKKRMVTWYLESGPIADTIWRRLYRIISASSHINIQYSNLTTLDDNITVNYSHMLAALQTLVIGTNAL